MSSWSDHFLSSTRGRIVELLRRGESTVQELAQALEVTNNAVRAQLTVLERDGLVQSSGKRAAVRKPETLYELTPEAEQLFPKAYDVLLNQLLTGLEHRLEQGAVDELLREVGRSLAAVSAKGAKNGSPGARVERAREVLSGMGGLSEIEKTPEGWVLRGMSCPLASAVAEHPNVCGLAEALLAELIGAPVEEQCDRSGVPKCLFLIRSTEAM